MKFIEWISSQKKKYIYMLYIPLYKYKYDLEVQLMDSSFSNDFMNVLIFYHYPLIDCNN